MPNKIKLKRGDVDDFYEPSDSDGEYTEREKSLLKKVRKGNKRNDEIEKEVLAFDDHDDDDDDDADDNDEQYDEFEENSDFEDEDTGRDGIPDERAWGKKRNVYHSTDFVDQDYSSYTVNEQQAAEQEEEEARAIQQRLAKQLDEADFTLDVFSSKPSATKDTQETKIHLKSDLSDLSHREKVQMFRKDSPEFEGLVADFEQRIQESQAVLEPVLQFFKRKQLTGHPIVDFVQTKNELILSYCSNVAFYLVLKAKRVTIKNHPLVKRLVQMRQLLLQLEEKYDNVVRPQLEKLLEAIAGGEDVDIETESPAEAPKVKKPKLRIVRAMDEPSELDEPMDEDEEDDDDDEEDLDEATEAKPKKSAASDSEEDEQEEENEDMGEDDERRQITYQMSKNKGLTPHRKKELRNPRVKHRNKFRKAVIRRKGAVRTVRKETKRYGGEVSGIKATTKKGIKIK